MEFKFAMTLKELRLRTSKSRYKKIEFLKLDSKEVANLSSDDKKVLKHLVKAGLIIDRIQLQLENPYNLEFLEFLDKEIAKNNEKAILAKKMFLSQKSIFSPDALGNQTTLVKNVADPLGQNYFPEDLTVEKFHLILNNMLDDGKIDEIKKILNQRTIVRYGDNQKNTLIAIDFIDAFSEEFKSAAKELSEAKKYSKNEEFNKFLDWQIKALESVNPDLDAQADKQWATLDENCKYEFTITREAYQEKLTRTIFDNDELAKRLAENGIEVYTKDSLGARVGLVNKKGTELLIKLKSLIDISAKVMPYQNEYGRKIESDSTTQKAVDVDLIGLYGDEGAYKASIVTAQNLPNSDKPSFKIGGGRRNVYHRQVRNSKSQKTYKNIICEEQLKYYNPEADHWAVICHENTHSLGPKSKTVGKYSSILEEYKADMGMYAFLDEFLKAGEFSDLQIKQIMVTGLYRSFLKGKPTLNQAHRTRSVMICNRMFTEKAIVFDDGGKLKFNFDKIQETAKNMLAEVVKIQIDADVKRAEKYVSKWFVWSDEIERVAEILKKYNKTLNGYTTQEYANYLLNEK